MSVFGMFGKKEAKEGAAPAGKNGFAKDPVCGMDVDMRKPPATSVYQGKTYYFCAPGCKKAFDTNPEKYLKQPGGHAQMQGG